MPLSSTAVPRRALSAVVGLSTLAAGLVVPLLLAAPVSAAPPVVSPGSAIEAFSPHQGQAVCDPVAHPGTIAFRQLVLAAYPDTGDSGIVRPCTAGGASEHKEGRAWDWRVSTSDPEDVAAVEDFFAWLLAPDEHGNDAAMARRLGVMYMIWDSQVWKSYQAARGWQPYVGASPHTDHVHVSLSWAGAYGHTSYWTGTVSPVVPGPAPTVTPGVAPAAKPATTPVTLPTASPSPVVDRALQRRLVVSRAPGPWRRH